MVRFLCSFFSFSQCRKVPAILAWVWFAGLVFGSYAALFNPYMPDSLIFSVVSGPPVPLALQVFLRLFPLLLLFFPIVAFRFVFLIPAVFFRAFLFSFSGVCVLMTPGASAWLFYLLLFLSDALSMTIHWFVWLSAPFGEVYHNWRFLFSAAVLISLITLSDYQFVVPFLMKLI